MLVVANDDELKKLELPRMNLGSLVRHFGPGLILMMTGIGTSHLVTAPTAGGRFAYALLWCIPVAYILSITDLRWPSDLLMQPVEVSWKPMAQLGKNGLCGIC